MKSKFLWWTAVGVCFFFTWYVEANFIYVYPSIPFPNFGNEWKWGNIKPAKISFFSTVCQREVSVAEIISPHEERISFFATQLVNQKNTQAEAIDFLHSVWREKYPRDTLIAKVRE